MAVVSTTLCFWTVVLIALQSGARNVGLLFAWVTYGGWPGDYDLHMKYLVHVT
ncbi:MAG: hypothetical protein M3294_06860 [Pseudomonadota bacterium]|nr:hypothetical protein [Pseudomonadota bacterium]